MKIGSGFSAQAVKSGGNRGTTRKASSWTRRGKRTAHASYKPMPWSKSLKCWSSYVKVGTLFGVITEDQYQNVLTHAEKSSPNGSVTKSVALIDDSGAWKNEKLIEFFPPNEEKLTIVMWAYSRHGAYTVKTGYKMIVRAKASSMGPVSQEDQVRNALKKRIWKILTLPNIRMFLWRAVSSALAVAERLKSGGLGVEITCKLCQGGTETINHVFFQCPTATRTWSDVGIALPIASLQCSLEDN
ncbi:hypothetical protein HID58_071215, partial [Brassica napus]